jgi:hypothetical protein
MRRCDIKPGVEVLINDKLGGELKIVLLDLGRGKWSSQMIHGTG